MSSTTQRPEASVPIHATTPSGSAEARDRLIRRAALVASVVVFGWSLVELVNLSLNHNTGPEVYGILVAALATGAGVANLVLLRSSRAQVLVIVAVLGVWAVVALGGIAGAVAHIVGAPLGEGPVDLRPRPATAPLVFTFLGLVGGAALLFGQRAAFRGLRDRWNR